MEHCNHQACLNNMPKCRLSSANLDINHDLYASAIRKNQDHPIFMALEVSVCEPQNYV